jgi:hypothetical protein
VGAYYSQQQEVDSVQQVVTEAWEATVPSGTTYPSSEEALALGK